MIVRVTRVSRSIKMSPPKKACPHSERDMCTRCKKAFRKDLEKIFIRQSVLECKGVLNDMPDSTLRALVRWMNFRLQEKNILPVSLPESLGG